MSLPTISVVIPVLNSAVELAQCLRALQRSGYAPAEVIVVDDGSSDGSVEVAAGAGATVIELEDTSGPSRARNRGAARASGDILLFVDADVCVHEDTLERVATRLAGSEWAAVFGSYDDDPGDPAFLSQYRNLMHAYVHQTSRTEASTFWCGCGAIRREVFAQSGGFDERVHRSAIEDVMFGQGLKAAGHRIRLDPDIRVRHLKHWDFWRMVVTDVRQRGIPWVHMILRSRTLQNDMNVDWGARLSLVLTWVVAVTVAVGTAAMGGAFVAPLAALFFLMLGKYWSQKTTSAVGVMVTAGAAGGLTGSMWWLDQLTTAPPLALGYVAFVLAARFLWAGVPAGLCVAWSWAATLFEWSRTGAEPWLLAGVAAVTGVVWLNRGFYRYLAKLRGGLFALGALPFRLLYHFLNGVSLVVGVVTYWGEKAEVRSQKSEVRSRNSGVQE